MAEPELTDREKRAWARLRAAEQEMKEARKEGASSDGILYSCTGEPYINEALRSVRSSLRYNKLSHLVFASADVSVPAHVEVQRFEPTGLPFADKIANMRRSPFEHTIYLDTDTLVLDEITPILRLLDRFDIAASRAPIPVEHDPEVPAAFHEFNTGVLAWRTCDRVTEFLRNWEETYLAWVAQGDPFPVHGAGSGGGRADQLAFRRCAWEHGLKIFVLAPEYNTRIHYSTRLVGRVRVLHGRHANLETLAAHINDSERARPWPRGTSERRRILSQVRRVARTVTK